MHLTKLLFLKPNFIFGLGKLGKLKGVKETSMVARDVDKTEIDEYFTC